MLASRRRFYVLLSFLLVVLIFELVFVIMAVKFQEDEKLRSETIDDFPSPAPALFTALAGTQTAKTWTATPSSTPKMIQSPSALF